MTRLVIMARNHYFSVFTMLILSTLLIGSSIVSVSEAASICPNGTVSYWALNEQSGTTAKDSWDANDGTVMYGESWVPGKVNNGHEFFGYGLTILAWFKADDFDINDGRIISKSTSIDTDDIWWMLSTRGVGGSGASPYRMRFRLKTLPDGETHTLIDGDDGTAQPLTDTTGASLDLATDTWYFAAAVYDGRSMKIYIDGTLYASADIPASSVSYLQNDEQKVAVSSAGVWIGDNPTTAGSRPFDGIIDEVALFNRELSQSEITGFYNGGTGQAICNGGCPAGLVSYWPFDEGSGTTTTDSKNGNDGTIQSGVGWTTGKIGNGLDFPGVGTDGYVDLGVIDVFNNYIDLGTFDVLPASDITILGWFKADDFGVNDGRIITKASGTGTDDHYWMLGTRGVGGQGASPYRMRFRVSLGGSTETLIDGGGSGSLTDTVVANVDLVADTWYFAAAVYDGSTMQIYLDGVLIASAAQTGTRDTNTAQVWMGDNPISVYVNRPFDGIIDEVALFSRALSGSEITALYNSGLGTGICVVGEATDSSGVSQSVFALGADIYATGSGFPPNTLINLYVVPAQTWSDGMPIPVDISSDGLNTVQTDAQGNIPPTLVWPNAQIGQYDLIFDNTNGQYDEGIDIIVGLTQAGFTVGNPSGIIGGVSITTNKVDIMAPYILTIMGLFALAVIAISIRIRKR
jgi:hypothetical protein